MTTIFCTFQQEGWHNWPSAPPKFAYLKERHRHIFHFKVEMQVDHSDRMVEFNWLKQRCQMLLSASFHRSDESIYGLEFKHFSCEKLCEWMLSDLRQQCLTDKPMWMACQVSEDGENGARVEIRP